MAAWSVRWKAAVKPQRFIETRASADRVGGLAPVARHEAAVGGGVHLAPLVHPEQLTVVGHAADAPGHRREADHRIGQPVAHERVGVAAGPQVLGQERAPVAAVDVVGVAHPVGSGSRRSPRRSAPRGRFRAETAGWRSARRRRRARCARRDSGWQGRSPGRAPGRWSRTRPPARRRPRRSMTASPWVPTGASGLQPP